MNDTRIKDPIDRCLQIESDLLDLKIGFGDSLSTGRIPWLISPDGYEFTPDQIQELEQIGKWAERFFKAGNKLYQEESFVRQLLDKGKPDFVLEFQRLALAQTQPVRMFRVDLLLTPDNTFKIVEFSLKPGGTGITAGLQEVYRDFRADSFPIGGGILTNGYQQLLSDTARCPFPVASEYGRALFAIAREKRRSLTEFIGLSFMLNQRGYKTLVGYADELEVKDGDLVYAYLPPRTWGKYSAFLRQACDRASVLIPPLYAFLKEKALFGLFWELRWEKFWRQELGAKGVAFLKERMIETANIDQRGKYLLNDRELRFNELLDLTSSARAKYLIKLSGFADGSSGAKGVVLGREVGRDHWQQALNQAKQSFFSGKGLYVLQPFVKSCKAKVRWLDWQAGEMKEGERYLRILAYYFVYNASGLDGAGKEAELAGVEVNSSAKPKVHLQTNVTSVPGINDRAIVAKERKESEKFLSRNLFVIERSCRGYTEDDI